MDELREQQETDRVVIAVNGSMAFPFLGFVVVGSAVWGTWMTGGGIISWVLRSTIRENQHGKKAKRLTTSPLRQRRHLPERCWLFCQGQTRPALARHRAEEIVVVGNHYEWLTLARH